MQPRRPRNGFQNRDRDGFRNRERCKRTTEIFMRYFDARVIENRSLGGGYYVLKLGGCESLAGCRPGQFVMLRGDWERDPLLPRAFSLLGASQDGRAEVLS